MSKTILVIDDQESVLEVIKAQVEGMGFRVITMSDPDRQIETILATEKIDAVVVDYKMPNMNGLQIIKKVREIKGQEIPIIMLSGMVSLDRDHIIKQGANDLFEKPLDTNQLKKLLDRELEEKQLIDIKDFESIELSSFVSSIRNSKKRVEIKLIEFSGELFYFEAPVHLGEVEEECFFELHCSIERSVIDFSFTGIISKVEKHSEDLEQWSVKINLGDLENMKELETVFMNRQLAILDFLKRVKGL